MRVVRRQLVCSPWACSVSSDAVPILAKAFFNTHHAMQLVSKRLRELAGGVAGCPLAGKPRPCPRSSCLKEQQRKALSLTPHCLLPVTVHRHCAGGALLRPLARGRRGCAAAGRARLCGRPPRLVCAVPPAGGQGEPGQPGGALRLRHRGAQAPEQPAVRQCTGLQVGGWGGAGWWRRAQRHVAAACRRACSRGTRSKPNGRCDLQFSLRLSVLVSFLSAARSGATCSSPWQTWRRRPAASAWRL